jgi:uncharacterized membrane protein
VLAIKVPTMPDGDQPGYLVQQLEKEWPQYITYVISFITILLMWINHHVMFERVKKVDHTLMILNGLMLLPITLVPFPTSLLAVFILHPQARYAAGLFAGSYVMIAGMYNLVWSHITRLNEKLGIEEDKVHLHRQTNKVRLVFVMYMTTFLLGFVNPSACVVACFLIAVYFALPELRNSEA